MFAPSRGRELKFNETVLACKSFTVRPLAGAGIEISLPEAPDQRRSFAPSRGRELKCKHIGPDRRIPLFAPSRGRELKYTVQAGIIFLLVRPLAGAGIEIRTLGEYPFSC